MPLTDILWNLSDRDVQISGTGSSADFTAADYMQVADQNGGILSQVAGMNPAFPMFGVNVNNTMGGPGSGLSFALGRWSYQCGIDNVNGGQGAIIAAAVPLVKNGVAGFELQVNYGN